MKATVRIKAACAAALWGICLFFLSCRCPGAAKSVEPPFAKSILSLAGKEILVELAVTDKEKSLGLMNRDTLEEDRGMLFLYAQDETPHFWMKNTRIPLSVGFFDAERRLVEVKDMEPLSLESVIPSCPIRFALEMNKGWFERNHAAPGQVFSFLMRKNEKKEEDFPRKNIVP